MGGEPGATGLPDAVVGVVDGRTAAPQIEVVMHNPSARVVMFGRGFFAGDCEILQCIEERLVALGQVAPSQRVPGRVTPGQRTISGSRMPPSCR